MSKVKPVLGQQKLEFKTNWMDRTAQDTRAGTSRNVERFPSDHEELVKFKSHLMGIGGKRRSASSADHIVAEISKMLYFGDSDTLDWTHLTNKNKMKLYMEKMDELKVGPEGQLTKLERLTDALDYLKYYHEDGRLATQVADIEFHIDRWKKVLRGEKKKLRASRLERVSDLNLDMSTITDVVDNPNLWNRFDATIEALQRGEDMTDTDLKLAMGSVTIALVLKSYQRPGAVCNCTVEEYRSAMLQDDVWVIKVQDHKTAMYGTAKLVMDSEMKTRVDRYFDLVRPKLAEPGKDVPNLFILPGSLPITKIGNLTRFMEKQLGLTIPSCTMVRKIGATSAARKLDDATHRIVTNQMSHTPAVAKKYYEGLSGCRDAAKAYKTMEQMRSGIDVQEHTQEQSLHTPSKSWAEDQVKYVEKVFKKAIESKKAPSLKECAAKLKIEGKTPKQIQDKVRTILRQRQKEAEKDQDQEESSSSYSSWEENSDSD